MAISTTARVQGLARNMATNEKGLIAIVKETGDTPEIRAAFVVGYVAGRMAISDKAATDMIAKAGPTAKSDTVKRTEDEHTLIRSAARAFNRLLEKAGVKAADARGGANNAKGKDGAQKGLKTTAKGKAKSEFADSAVGLYDYTRASLVDLRDRVAAHHHITPELVACLDACVKSLAAPRAKYEAAAPDKPSADGAAELAAKADAKADAKASKVSRRAKVTADVRVAA